MALNKLIFWVPEQKSLLKKFLKLTWSRKKVFWFGQKYGEYFISLKIWRVSLEGAPFVVNRSSQTCHEGLVEVSPLDQQRALYTPLHRSGSRRRWCGNTVFTQYQEEPCRFLFEIHKNIENMDCTTGFRLESHECVCEVKSSGVCRVCLSDWSSAPILPHCPFPSSRMVWGGPYLEVVQNPFSNHLVKF